MSQMSQRTFYAIARMGLFRRKAYQRWDSLAAASKAHARGKTKKAIAEYTKVLEHEPENFMVLGKLATLRAERKEMPEAREKFISAARGFEKKGFDDKALATYALAVGYMPKDLELVEMLADKHLSRSCGADAIKTLMS